MKNESIKKLTLSAMFLSLGVVLPMLTGQIQQIGSMLLPMHIPIFLCALICGYKYGIATALILPLLRSFVFGVPNLYPEAIAIAFEMAAYALVAGLMYENSKWQCIRSLYRALGISMISGRIARTIVQLFLLGATGKPFVFGLYFTSVIVRGIPGVILQLILIPAIMILCHKTKLVLFRKNKTKEVFKD